MLLDQYVWSIKHIQPFIPSAWFAHVSPTRTDTQAKRVFLDWAFFGIWMALRMKISFGRTSRPRQYGNLKTRRCRQGEREDKREGEVDKSNPNDSFRVHCRPLEGSVFERNARKVAPFFAARHSHNCDLRGTGQLRSPDNGAATRNGQSNNLDFTVVRQ